MVMGNRAKNLKFICLLLGFWLLARGINSQELPRGIPQDTPQGMSLNDSFESQPVPEDLRRPDRGEAPRYPRDLVIGELGRMESPEGAYNYAQSILSAIVGNRRDSQVLSDSGFRFSDSLFNQIESIRPRYYRIGGGRREVDGSISFIIRIVGSNESITGELYVRPSETTQPEIKLADSPIEPPPDSPLIEDDDDDDYMDDSEEPEIAAPRAAPSRWFLDDLILEDKRPLADIRDSYRFDFSPYERFF